MAHSLLRSFSSYYHHTDITESTVEARKAHGTTETNTTRNSNRKFAEFDCTNYSLYLLELFSSVS